MAYIDELVFGAAEERARSRKGRDSYLSENRQGVMSWDWEDDINPGFEFPSEVYSSHIINEGTCQSALPCGTSYPSSLLHPYELAHQCYLDIQGHNDPSECPPLDAGLDGLAELYQQLTYLG